MNKTEVIELINRNPAMQLASVDKDGDPHTRGMLMYSADESGIVFHTGSFKPLYEELKGHPKVEMSFFDQNKFDQVRITGTAREIDDQKLKEKIVATPGREFLKPWIEKSGYGMLKVFKVENCRATVWNMASNFEYPKKVIEF